MTATATLTPEEYLATIEGEVCVSGLEAPVTVTRDRWGIPHIRAVSAHDAFFAQGFAIAQDRLWQLELYRSMANGRAAALLSRGLLKLDIQNRRLGFARYAAKEWEAQSEEARMVLQAYADGINAAIATQPRPYEFHVLGHEMEPWHPRDSLAVIKMVNAGVQWASKLKIGQVASKLGIEAAQALVPGVPLESAVITPSGENWTGAVHPFKDDFASAMGQPDGPQASGGGSNCWVIHGSKTESGWPLVAGDPHLALTVPGQWYVVHMECPEFTAAGPCNPCYPGPVFYGHNTKVAWTMTHAQGDRWDLYRETVRQGAAGPEALFQGEWTPLTRIDEEYGVKGGAAETHTTWLTRHGPVVFGNPEKDDEVIAARWGLAEPAHDMDAMLAMLRATNLDEARAALRGYDSVSGNYCFADMAGNIGYQYTGRLPSRPAWLMPVPGWSGEYEGQGDVPKVDLPIDENPRNGFIMTANNRTTQPGYPHYLTYAQTPFRANRLRELLDNVETFDFAGMAPLHADQVSVHARTRAAILLRRPATTEAGRALQQLLDGWDGSMAADSAEALAWDFVCDALCRATVQPFYAQADAAPEMTVLEQRRVLFDQLTAESPLMLQGFADWDTAIDAALAVAAGELEAAYGADPARWRWGDRHVAEWRHNLGRDAEFAALLNLPDVPIGGHGDTVFSTMVQNGASSTHGVSYRQVIDLSDVNGMRICIPPGNSGQPGSPHYGDNLERWANVEYHPLYVDWDDIAANAEGELTLTT